MWFTNSRGFSSGLYEELILLIRELRASDSSALLALRNREDDFVHYKTQQQVSELEHGNWISDRLKNVQLITLIAEHADQLIGTCYLSPLTEDSFEISIRFIPECRGLGFGSQLLQATIDKAREVGFKSVIGMVSGNNLASMALFIKNGFTLGVSEDKNYHKFIYFLKNDLA